jgi:hypothetical protein
LTRSQHFTLLTVIIVLLLHHGLQQRDALRIRLKRLRIRVFWQ